MSTATIDISTQEDYSGYRDYNTLDGAVETVLRGMPIHNGRIDMILKYTDAHGIEQLKSDFAIQVPSSDDLEFTFNSFSSALGKIISSALQDFITKGRMLFNKEERE